MSDRRTKLALAISVAALAATGVVGQDFTLDWWTVDGGGEMWTTGGDFELSGTVGQPDASTVELTGGDFELTGGFWTPPLPAMPVVLPSETEQMDEPAVDAEPEPPPSP